MEVVQNPLSMTGILHTQRCGTNDSSKRDVSTDYPGTHKVPCYVPREIVKTDAARRDDMPNLSLALTGVQDGASEWRKSVQDALSLVSQWSLAGSTCLEDRVEKEECFADFPYSDPNARKEDEITEEVKAGAFLRILWAFGHVRRRVNGSVELWFEKHAV